MWLLSGHNSVKARRLNCNSFNQPWIKSVFLWAFWAVYKARLCVQPVFTSSLSAMFISPSCRASMVYESRAMSGRVQKYRAENTEEFSKLQACHFGVGRQGAPLCMQCWGCQQGDVLVLCLKKHPFCQWEQEESPECASLGCCALR